MAGHLSPIPPHSDFPLTLSALFQANEAANSSQLNKYRQARIANELVAVSNGGLVPFDRSFPLSLSVNVCCSRVLRGAEPAVSGWIEMPRKKSSHNRYEEKRVS
jgi:hypothetical protein